MPLVIEMQVKLLFAYGVRNRLFGFGIVYFYVDMTSSIGRYLLRRISGVSHRSECNFFKLSGTKVAHFCDY